MIEAGADEIPDDVMLDAIKLAHKVNGEVIDFIRRCKAPNFESVRLFDIFIDDELKKSGKKSMAYSLSFRNRERTLTDAEVNTAMDKLRTRLANELKVELR